VHPVGSYYTVLFYHFKLLLTNTQRECWI